MIEKHFKKIVFFLMLLGLGYLAHITRYETLRSGFKYRDGYIRTDIGTTNGYFLRDRWTNQIKWKEMQRPDSRSIDWPKTLKFWGIGLVIALIVLGPLVVSLYFRKKLKRTSI